MRSMATIAMLLLMAPLAAAAELKVWNADVTRFVHTFDGQAPHAPLEELRLYGARHGVFSGQVVVGSAGPIKGLAAECGDLVGPGGFRIPSSAILVRYPACGDRSTEQVHGSWVPGAGRSRISPVQTYGGELRSAPPVEVAVDLAGGGAVQPVWVTVRVPADARPGAYAGTLTVRAGGAEPLAASVDLQVADWTVPNPGAFVTHAGIIQSPDSVALQYGVPMWSERHWQLLERSFELMGELGAKEVYLPLIRQTHFGNEHSMVRWVKGPAGGYTHDFSIAERYLDLAVKHLGRAPVVCLYVWDACRGSIYTQSRTSKDRREGVDGGGVLFSVLDPASGELTEAVGPTWGTPEARDFWQPVVAGLKKRLADRGLAGSLRFGLAGDWLPTKETIDDLQAIAPGVKWMVHSHGRTTAILGRDVVDYNTLVLYVQIPQQIDGQRCYGWRKPCMRRGFEKLTFALVYPRYNSQVVGCLTLGAPPAQWRCLPEATLLAGCHGFGRIGADFWPVLKTRTSLSSILGRYPVSDWRQLGVDRCCPYLLAPGPDGAVPTVRFEMLREGLQEAEARVCLERILAETHARSTLDEERVRGLQALLDARAEILLRLLAANRGPASTGPGISWWDMQAFAGWQERAAQLYAAAAKADPRSVPRAIPADTQTQTDEQ